MTTTQCRSIYMIDTGIEAVYYRCLLDRGHSSRHYGVAIDQFGALIPERSEEVTWLDSHSLNSSESYFGSEHPQDPAQMKLDMETPQ